MTNLREKIEGILNTMLEDMCLVPKDGWEKGDNKPIYQAVVSILSAISEELPKDMYEPDEVTNCMQCGQIYNSFGKGFNKALSQLKQILGVTNEIF